MGFRGDDRAQAIQVGVVLLFAILVVLFSVYQAFVVPSQNRRVEFNHNQRVQGDLVELRNSLLTSWTTGEDGYATVELGTRFPPRLFALNPAPPSGTLATTQPRPIVVEQGGSDVTAALCPGADVQTRFVEYRPDYSVYQGAGTLRYENGLLYHDFGDRVVTLSDQQLVEGDTVNVAPVRGAYSQGGSGTVSVETRAGRLDTSQRQNLTVTLPTRLTEPQWEQALGDAVDPANVTVTEGAGGRNLTLSLGGTVTINCGPIGVGRTPPGGARGSGTGEINPAAPGNIKLVDETLSGRTVSLSFNNTAGATNVTQARLNFYEGQGTEPTQADIARAGEPVSATLVIGEDFETLDPDIRLDGESVTVVDLTFDRNVNPNDWFVLTLQLETGQTATYFVSAGG
ncbi:MAG: hypothetical protein ABEJ30_07855 [Halorientalis sp.]